MEPFSFFIIIALLAFRWAWFVRESKKASIGLVAIVIPSVGV
jgi:hypothetical protein